MAFTFFGQGFTPRGVTILPQYSICCCLIQHSSGLNFSPALWALCTVSRRCRSCRSLEDPLTLTSFAQGNVSGMPSSALSICSQRSPPKRTNQTEGVENSISWRVYWRLWEAGFPCLDALPSTHFWHLMLRSRGHFWKLCCTSSQDAVSWTLLTRYFLSFLGSRHRRNDPSFFTTNTRLWTHSVGSGQGLMIPFYVALCSTVVWHSGGLHGVGVELG